MSYPYDASDLAAITRLGSYYNGSAYNAGSNPGGMAAGGHRTNFTPSLQDVALIADAIADAAAAAAASAVSTAADVILTAANVAKLAGTSTSSVAIGTGSKSFTTQASKFFNVGTYVFIVSDANPTVNFMEGQVTAYSGTALTVNVTVIGGSGTKTDWSIYTSGAPGVTGSTGAAGAQGETPSLKWTFGNGITDTDPGNGIFVINNATYSGATFLYFDNLDANSVTATTFLDALDDSTTTANRGTIFLQQVGTAATYAMFSVTGAVIDGTGYRKVPVSHIMSSGAFSNGIPVAVTFQRTGNSGADGGGAGDTISDISSGTDGRVVVFSGTSGKHINQASYGIGTSGTNIGALSTANTWGGAQAFAAITVTGTALHTSANAAALIVGPNGATNPAFTVDTATASAATGLKITAAAAAAGLALLVMSSGTDENLTINAKGAGTVTINGTATGAIALGQNTTVAGTGTITSANASAFTVGRLGATTPAFHVDASTGTSITGVKVKSAASTGGVAISAIGETNVNLTIDAAGSGTITIGGTSTGNVILPTNVITGRTEDTSPDGAADYLWSYDASATANKKILLHRVTAFKTILTTFDMTAASGTVDIVGFGFNPKAVSIIFAINGGVLKGVGYADSSGSQGGNWNQTDSADGSSFDTSRAIIASNAAGTASQVISVSFIADGIRFTNTKTGGPTGTLSLAIMGHR